ncbi:hypothetical protein Tco_0871016 [Tanacetum coccineum]
MTLTLLWKCISNLGEKAIGVSWKRGILGGLASYGNIWYDEDVHDLRSVETEFPAIVYNDVLTSEVLLSCEPTVSPLDDIQIDLRILFDESDDEEYTSYVSYPIVMGWYVVILSPFSGILVSIEIRKSDQTL